MTERQSRILLELRNGPLNHYQIAADLDEAPFTVRADLKALKRDRLVSEHIGLDAHTWDLTLKGVSLAWGQQLELGA